ncbi:hypothetical protein JCM10450v2_003643 [Rhodotorula kratochvilovae]
MDRADHLAKTTAAEPSHGPPHTQEWTVQLAPDYDAAKERRSAQEAQREVGSADADATHPSSTAFLLTSLLKSIAENPYERAPPPVHAAAHGPTSPRAQAGALPLTSPRGTAATLPPSADPAPPAVRSDAAWMTPEEALATLHFIPLDKEQPLPLVHLPREVLLLSLQHLVLSSILPPPRGAHTDPAQEEHRERGGGKRCHPKRRTLREVMALLEAELKPQYADRPWKSEVEALKRLRASLYTRAYVGPQQMSRKESAAQLVEQHGADWQHIYIKHYGGIDFQEWLIQEREGEIEQAEQGITELNQIFKDLGQTVGEQQSMIDNIETHITSFARDTHSASTQLTEAHAYQGKAS